MLRRIVEVIEAGLLVNLKVRRSSFIDIRVMDEPGVDIDRLLRGEFRLVDQIVFKCFSSLTRESLVLGNQDLVILQRTPNAAWIGVEDLLEKTSLEREGFFAGLSRLARVAVLITDSEDLDLLSELRRMHDAAEAIHWSAEAFYFHRANSAIESEAARRNEPFDYEAKLKRAEQDADEFIRKRGMPPPTFFDLSLDAAEEVPESVELPVGKRNGSFFQILESRRTSRLLSLEDAISKEDLSTLLFYSFGAQGVYRLSSAFNLQHKVSPSGGGLHPIEAFPIILNAEGVDPGIYHYNTQKCRLDRISSEKRENLRTLIGSLAQGQEYANSAGVVVVLVARLARNFWKYRSRPNTYNVIMTDAGHLSQTFYLTSNALGLGAFYSAALDGARVLQALNLDEIEFATIGICGCGVLGEGGGELEVEPLD